MKILIVHKNFAGGQALAHALSGDAVKPLVAKDCREAIELSSQESLDVLVIDLDLGESRGDDFAARAALQHPGLRCVLVTNGELSEAPLCHPFDVVLRKPVDLDMLEAVVQRWKSANVKKEI